MDWESQSKLFRLFWYTAEVADNFDSDEVDGEETRGSLRLSGVLDVRQENLPIIASTLMPLAFKSTAELYKLFWEVTHNEGSGSDPSIRGFANFEAYFDIPGSRVQNLLGDPRYPNQPSFTTLIGALDSRQVFLDDSREKYGGVIRGFISPKETAQYEFFLRSDDASQFYLSADENPSGLTLLAEETSCCGTFEEPGAAETSAPVSLSVGRRYAFLLLWKEDERADYAQVALRKIGDLTSAATLRPISGEFLSTVSTSLPDPFVNDIEPCPTKRSEEPASGTSS